MAALVDLTPQRFDLILHLRKRPMIQRDLARELGVVRSVVSKMVTALEELGIVERRAVKGVCRSRLVVLTQRAFDLMRGLYKHGAFDFQGLSLQGNAEHVELERFRAKLKAERVGVERLSCRNHRALLMKMRATIDRTTPGQYVWFAPFDPSLSCVATTHAYWRNTRVEWRPCRGERRHAKAHLNAGVPLDFHQRFPRRKRGRPPRGGVKAAVARDSDSSTRGRVGREDCPSGSGRMTTSRS